tara:strand:- start:45 stop:1127 length:1083 start_codon:yes stop_codon:yes gene_type:complete
MSKQTDLINVTDAITVDGSNVGIGIASPDRKLHVHNTNGAAAKFGGTGGGSDFAIEIGQLDSSNGSAGFNAVAGAMKFQMAGSEAMRLDGGNLLVGQSSSTAVGAGNTTTGFSIRNDGGLYASRSSGPTITANSNANGDIIKLYKSGTAVGIIGNSGNYMFLASQGPSARGVKITDNFIPATTSGANNDNVMDLGGASVRWDDIYATNGTIQTSDRNEKQDIEALNDAETAVAVACKGLLRKFRWIDSVAEKGDDARIHFGIIAQDLQDAFTAEGLDAGRYAMFISSTWWETQTDVPAVEAVDEVLDEDGNVVTEAVEAKDAYTRTDTYETLEEAPEGATERTRLGVRYPELLAFIIGAM